MKSKKSNIQDEFMAASIGDLEWLRQSLRKKTSYIDFDENGLSALHLASIHGRFECIKFLIEDLCVNIDLSSAHGWRPIHLCINNKIGKRSLQTLLYLIHKGANLSASNEDGFTPIHQAANEGNFLCLKQLIEAGADFTSKDNRGNRPIDLAKLWGHKKCAKLLATYSWHHDKNLIINERYEMKKSEIREILERLEKSLDISDNKRFDGSQAFYKWLYKNTAGNSKKKPFDDKEEEDRKKDIELKKYKDNVNNRKLKESVINHSEVWKVSNSIPQYFHPYPGNLRDIYPRHPYTLEPLTWSTPTEMNPNTTDLATKLLIEKNQNLVRKAAEERYKLSVETKPKHPLRAQSSNRMMYYKTDSVLDLIKKKTPKSALLQKTNDSVFCLTNDLNSLLFRSALNFPLIDDVRTCPSTASTDLNPYMTEDSNFRLLSTDILSIEN